MNFSHGSSSGRNSLNLSQKHTSHRSHHSGSSSPYPQEFMLNFTRTYEVNMWTRMLECDEFVGARRSKHTCVAYKDGIFVFGGDNGKSMLNDLIRFDCKELSWSKIRFSAGCPPAPRYHHSAVIHKQSMFVFGGYTGELHTNSNLTNKNDLFEYKFQNGQWVEWKFIGKTPVARSAHGAAVYDNKLWIYAGYDGNARLADMWALPLDSDGIHQWEEVEQKGDIPPTCCNFPVAIARGCMWVFSGQSGLQITNTLFQFNFKDQTWRRITNEHILRASAPAPSRRYGHTMIHHDRFLYVFGGAADSTLPNDLHCYDLDAQVWSIISPASDSDVPGGRLFHAAAVVGDAMYIFGGTIDNNVRSGDLYRFQLSSYPKCTLHDDFGSFLAGKNFCDVQFVVGADEVKIPAHQAIVVARSQFLRTKILAARDARNQHFEKIFGTTEVPFSERPMLEVSLPNATPEAFEMVLHYVYTDRIEFKESSTKPVVLMMDVYQLAVEFLIPRLEQLCVQYLEYKIAKDNVLDALFNADRMNLPLIKDHCLSYIVKEDHYYEIVMSSEFAVLEKPLIVEIVRKRLNPGKYLTAMKYDKTIGTTLEADMAAFLAFGGKEFCDINLQLDGKLIPAHKSVLAARCSYFQGLLRSFLPADNIVNIQIGDVHPSLEAFNSLLRYIYYGDTNMPPEDSLYLFQAPCFYGFTNNRLQAFCKHNLENNISYDNVLQILEVADHMNVPDIKNYALRMVVVDFPQVARLPRMRNLSRDLLLDIIMAMADVLGEIRMKNDLTSISIHSEGY